MDWFNFLYPLKYRKPLRDLRSELLKRLGHSDHILRAYYSGRIGEEGSIHRQMHDLVLDAVKISPADTCQLLLRYMIARHEYRSATKFFLDFAPQPILARFLDRWWQIFLSELPKYRGTKLELRNLCSGDHFSEATRLCPPAQVLNELRDVLAAFDALPREPETDFMGQDHMSDLEMKAHVAEFYSRLQRGSEAVAAR